MFADQPTDVTEAPNCCPLYHEAVELVGRRWTGAILGVLLDGSLRFSEIAQAIPELSDRLLSERMKELEARGMVRRTVIPGPPLRVRYELSEMGRELEPALTEIRTWARRWLGARPSAADEAARAARPAGPPARPAGEAAGAAGEPATPARAAGDPARRAYAGRGARA